MEHRSPSWISRLRRPVRIHDLGLHRSPGGKPEPRACILALGLVAILAITMAAEPTTRDVKSLGLQAPEEEVKAPDFALPDLAGKKSRLTDFRGKVVVLNFFATWCLPCRDEMPALERLHQTYKDKGLAVLAVEIRESAKDVRTFMQEFMISFPALLDADGSVASTYGIRPVPATYLISPDGKIVWRAFGAREWDSNDAFKYFCHVLTRKS
jgi:peroxiredoxin